VEAMTRFRAWMKENAVVPWDGKKNTGYARYLVIREGKRTGQRMITLVTADGELPARDKFIAALSPLATTLYHGINPTITDLSIASKLELLHGAPELEEQIAGKMFRIPPNSFFQTNSEMAEVLVQTAREFLSPRAPKILLDLYCGTGLFGICLAGDAERVLGVEADAEAIAVASGNAERNGVKNATFVAAKAEELLQWESEKPDTVIIDPPRAGLHPKVAGTLLALAPERILYVSCNYESLVRDFAILGREYKITRIAALDLFPHSPHVETIALLERK
jgi:23S rRNA (uracil1939-C5)-methyltransferase